MIALLSLPQEVSAALLAPAGCLREGNALLNVGFAVMNVAGPAAAGFLVAGVGVVPVIALAAAVLAALAVLAATTRGAPPASADEGPWGARLRAGAAT